MIHQSAVAEILVLRAELMETQNSIRIKMRTSADPNLATELEDITQLVFKMNERIKELEPDFFDITKPNHYI